MDGSQLRDLIGQKRPRYKEQYRLLIDSISKKGYHSAFSDSELMFANEKQIVDYLLCMRHLILFQ